MVEIKELFESTALGPEPRQLRDGPLAVTAGSITDGGVAET
jgi:hypothetical protein